MRLEDAPDLPVRVIVGGCQRSPDLCWMVRIIVNDGDTVHIALVFKTPVCPVKILKAFPDGFRGNTQQFGCCDRRQCVGYVVISVDGEKDTFSVFSFTIQIEGSFALLVMRDIGRAVLE